MVQLAAGSRTREQSHRMTYEEFLANVGENVHAEWVDGEVCIFVPPTIRHQRIAKFLAILIHHFVRGRNLGEVLIAPCEMRFARSAREPDILFIAREHADRVSAQRVVGPADLVVEIISDESVTRDRRDKFQEYAEAGVAEYWIIDPREGMEEMTLYVRDGSGRYAETAVDGKGRLHSTVLPGFWLDPAWLLTEELPNELTILAEMAPDLLQHSR